ncbi:efflux RND transporter periplasmic adaptor subunit [Notoacmeibacter sp. MSK16QG-6]|uniref:efflux RND transporter periplasmic adaptor subunit n=1 Tax=Notoacmeibacter sp. MSK16QG-6 TaxID=2957982 RepID=UPI00209C7FA4|nr:efflux RND transporter periplasmic adaptor subunit [Notoacmeibacter sp. MSK16QG-6]MCP1198470.1 efflux RND transporter periplasmic adaptor subunit [Notoacmeibacter sp. MSK16QG-6]
MGRFLLLSIMAAALTVGPASSGFANDADAARPTEVQTKPPAIRVTEADERHMTASLPANGTIAPRQEAVVGTNLSGLAILELLADEGDFVEKGEVLARLDTNSLDIQRIQAVAQRDAAEAQVAQAQSQVADARVAVSQAEDALGRQEQLRKSGTVAKAALDDSRYSLDSARAKLSTAERAVTAAQSQIAVSDAQIRDIDRRIADAEVTALSSGLVLERNATLGAVVAAGSSPLFRIAVDGQLELAAEVSETELVSLEPGMKANVFLPGREEPIEGTVRIVDPEIDSVTRLGTVRIVLPKTSGLRTGAFARAEIQTVDRQAVAVPSTAILFDGRRPQLQKVVDSVIETTPVEIGVRTDGFIEVRNGVDAGDLIVSRAGTFVADGDRIRPIRETASVADAAQKTGSID